MPWSLIPEFAESDRKPIGTPLLAAPPVVAAATGVGAAVVRGLGVAEFLPNGEGLVIANVMIGAPTALLSSGLVTVAKVFCEEIPSAREVVAAGAGFIYCIITTTKTTDNIECKNINGLYNKIDREFLHLHRLK